MDILVVDDSATSRLKIRKELQGAFTVEAVGSAQECLDMLGHSAPKLITLDVEMPGMDGYELCRVIRTHSSRQDCSISTTPIIFVTGHDSVSGRLKGFACGGSDFINKTFARGELLHRAKMLLTPDVVFSQMKVLVVEDEPITRRLIQTVVAGMGAQVITAQHGLEGLQVMEQLGENIDLVISDCSMPHMTGPELCRNIRSRFGLSRLPVMFVCGEKDDRQTIEIFKSGATSLHRKPFIKEELVSNVSMHLLNKLAERRLKAANLSLQEVDKLKSEFLANMSHEIRTPLNGILGLTALTLETDLTPEQQDHLKLVHESATHLLEVVNDILDFSKIEANRFGLHPEPFDLHECIESTMNLCRVQAQKKSIEVLVSMPPSIPQWVVGDAGRIRQVLINLIGNAVKFTPESGGVVLHVSQSSGDRSTSVMFSVVDSGIGIPKSLMGRIFDPFEQADSSHARRFGGTGLGLSISSSLVGMMGGRIWADSLVGVGSAFHIEIPFVAAPASFRSEKQDIPAPAPHIARSLRILLAEDNKVNQTLAKKLLEKAGHSVVLAENGLEAVKAFQAEPFDVVLLDIQMPEMDGEQACARIRELQAQSSIRTPIIAVTAHAMAGDKERYLAQGMDGYVTKPLNKHELLEAIRVLTLRPLGDK